MSTKERSANAPTIPVLRLLPRLIRDPLGTLGAVSRSAGGRVVRLDGGLFRPYLLTHPEHVQHVLVDRASSYLRTGKLWTQLQRLEGTGLAGEGAAWRASRALYQPAFTARNIRTVTARMAAAIADAVDELGERAAGRPIDAGVEMTRIVHRALLAAFWGDRITVAETERLGAAITTAVNSIGPRLILPFVPQAVPLPGDRAFARAVRTVDEVIYPLVRQARLQPDSDDLLSIAVTARGKDGRGLTDRQIRDDVVALFVGGTEATALVLTWLWVILDTQPAVAAALYDEIDGLTDEPYQDQLDRLTYTDLVLREVMRLYPPSWLLPRTVAEDDVIDGVRIPAGATVVLSQYLTHRSPEFWADPETFEPERFVAGVPHPFAYFPFGAGPHRCVGSHLFRVDARLIVAAVLRRFRPELAAGGPLRPYAGITIRPHRAVKLILRPVDRGRPPQSDAVAQPLA